MQLDEAIRGRRAVRAYTAELVNEEHVHALVRAATQAPNAMNAQPWIFSVVQNKSQLKKYSDRAKAVLLEQSASHPKVRAYEDILRSDLSAYESGLGTCCIGFAFQVLNTRDVKTELGIPEGGAAVAPIIVGYPAFNPPQTARSEPRIVSWAKP